MGILKPMGYDSYSYQVGEFPIAKEEIDKVKDGMFCKLNEKKEICTCRAGEKGFMTVFPKNPGRSGFAILHACFLIGDFVLNIDEECFETGTTYTAQDQLFVGTNGKITNHSAVAANPVPVAEVLRPVRVINGVKTLSITSPTGLPVAKNVVEAPSDAPAQ